MKIILGIDAAWTVSEPSGVALVSLGKTGCRCIAVAPSYDAFYALSQGASVDWTQESFIGTQPNTQRLLRAARQLSGKDVDIVAVDIPVATVPIIGRRAADVSISRGFGGRGCAAHSPNNIRPGRIGRILMRNLESEGYPLATTTTKSRISRHTVEVYPHPALLTLMNQRYRVPYKVGKSKRYWPRKSKFQRVQSLLANFRAIDAALARCLGPTGVPLPAPSSSTTLAHLKRFEDALDALICAWVGTRYLSDAIEHHGDPTAAIWTP